MCPFSVCYMYFFFLVCFADSLNVAQAFTSKTCGKCGHLNNKLGGSRTFNCRACKHTEDRDVHAARNILLRYLLEQGIGPALVLLQARSRKAAAGTSPDPALAGNGNTGARKRRLSE